MAFTSNEVFAGSDDSPAVELEARNSSKSVILYDLPKNDFSRGKGDLWRIDISDFQFEGCIRVDDITGIAIVPVDTDAWNIDSIVTFVENYDGKFQLVSQDIDVYRWVDKTDHPVFEHFNRFDLSLVS